MTGELFIGLMSGTSLDGVDGVVADFSGEKPRILAHATSAFNPALRADLLALNTSGPDELHRAALAANALARSYAGVVAELLMHRDVNGQRVAAIGAHGQTVRHRPQAFDGTGYTIQLNQPALLAELTGLPVVADFRSRDVAAGGQGAPLAPFFHRAVFADDGMTVGVLNLGGISNLSLLRADGSMTGFDCGPANALMDGWCERHRGLPFDEGGAWAATGSVVPSLLARMLDEPYFAAAPPKSTGRDLFNADWLAGHLDGVEAGTADVQATLAELTARSVQREVERHEPSLARLIVCGGGAFNTHVMERLRALLPQAAVASSADWGIPPLQVEAAAFAWLARKTLRGESLPLESTTGAQGARVLGCVYPA